jgi:hypothetical protein
LDALRRAQASDATADEVKGAINEIAPELNSVADLLPQNRGELFGAIQAICGILGVLMASYAIYFSPQQGITKEQMQEVMEKAITIKAPAQGESSERAKRKRNLKRQSRRRGRR